MTLSSLSQLLVEPCPRARPARPPAPKLRQRQRAKAALKRCAIVLAAAMAPMAAAEAQTSVFEGRWRIVAAEPAAWSSTRATPAPLLRAGMIFKDGSAVLPKSAFCDRPQREEAWIPSRWLLGGEMSGKVLRSFYGRHGITEGANLNGMTLTCGDQETKLVLAEEGRALLAHEGWVYTLRRGRNGSDAAGDEATTDDTFVKVANAGFDCARATTTVERLTCGHPDAMAADAAMARAYGALRSTLSPAAEEALKRSQAAFNEDRALACGAKGDMPKDASRRSEIESCLADVTDARASYLSGLAPVVAGALLIEPQLSTVTKRRMPGRIQSWRASGWIAQDARPVLFGASPAVTRSFDRILQSEAYVGRPLVTAAEDLEGGRERSYVVHLLTERFASLRFMTRTDAGTSTAPAIVAVNIDMRSGRSVPIDGMLDVRRGGFTEAFAKAVEGQVQDEAYFKANLVGIASGEDGAWSFTEDKAIVSWQRGGAAPPEEVEIPAAVLAPFLKADSPWQPKSAGTGGQPPRR